MEKINDFIFSNELDNEGDLHIESPSTSYDDRFFLINKEDAERIVEHLKKVFELNKEIKTFKTKRHNNLSEYLTDVRSDRLDEWQMDEVIKYVTELEDGFEELRHYFLCITNGVYIDDEEIMEVRNKYLDCIK